MDVTRGEAALQGWRAKAADRLAPAVAKRTSLAEEQVRGALGFLFLALAARYVLRTLGSLRAR